MEHTLNGVSDRPDAMDLSADLPALELPIKPYRQPSTDTMTALAIDLADYIRLGCITTTVAVGELVTPSKSSWSEILPSAVPKGAGPLSSVYKLHQSRLIRIFARASSDLTVLRVYLLPDDVARGRISRSVRGLQTELENLLSTVNVHPGLWSWNGLSSVDAIQHFEPWGSAEEGSLFYIFNTLPSPAPRPDLIQDRFTRQAVRDVLEDHVPGLISSLYPYQARSAAAMLQREGAPELHMDPRFERRDDPDGQPYYFAPNDLLFHQSPPMYEANRGGILAEQMGLGKTIICLAVVLATKHHLPRIPEQYLNPPLPRESVPSLLDLAISTANRFSLPTKSYLDRLRQTTGDDVVSVMKRAESHPPTYSIPGQAARKVRRTQIPPPKKMTLSSGTIVVVPRNLIHQWRSELKRHVSDGLDGLKVFVADNPRIELPPPEELRHYDIVLFSKPRFEKEIRDGNDKFGRNERNSNSTCHCPYIGSSRIRDCSCLRLDDVYSSPLKNIHWLRIIIDEGHDFSSASSNAVLVARKLVTADRRWVVSGTPARDRLFGVEVDLAADAPAEFDAQEMQLFLSSSLEVEESEASTPVSDTSHALSSKLSRYAALEQRKAFNRQEETGSSGAARSLGLLASHFLKVRPWLHESGEERRVDWDQFIYRHESHRMRTYSAFSSCLRQTLESLVIKTQPDDVERDIILPPLSHKVVYLEPSHYDKITANLFILFLTANAVTSERTDVDYLFHKNSAKARHSLIANLRQSNFFWTGFSLDDIHSAIGHSTRYLEKENTNASAEDRALLRGCLEFAQMLLGSERWAALSKFHEIGLFAKEWPENGSSWALSPGQLSKTPPMLGVSQLLQAQELVNRHLFESDPFDGLFTAGEATMKALEEDAKEAEKKSKSSETKMGVPTSGVEREPLAAKRHTNTSPRKTSPKTAKHAPKKPNPKQGIAQDGPVKPESDGKTPASKANADDGTPVTPNPMRSRKRKREYDNRDLPPDSSLRNPAIIGTVSSKLSYLLSRIVELQEEEKILVFYDGDNIAYYIAQCLDLLHIKHLIYAKSLSADQKSKYVVAFDTDPSIRVLVMDIRSGAFGLNINKASRVFFVNPVCRPSVEVQAIKRAHRIGQTKPVFVETLILKGTIEEAMFERSKNMTRREHMEASQLSDDSGIASIIQNATMLPISIEEGEGMGQMAPLQEYLQLFGRKGRGDMSVKGIDLDIEGDDSPRKKHKSEKIPKGKRPSEANAGDDRMAFATIPTAAVVNGESGTNTAAGLEVSTLARSSIFGP